ncbi:ABC transporter substrate-binding protein [Paeniglutamicibacter sp. NPDC091659]|uniref:ABC transporter substrate-binding protein n=1 Tax=Paeniglutamicibacter sp. NPDC091659 TaxID=3364389 RepID=UPI00380C06C7
MKLSLRSMALLAVGSLTLSMAACSTGNEPAAAPTPGGSTTLKVGTIGLTSDAAIELAKTKGYFKDEGLTVETSVVANPPAGVAAAQSGQLDLTYTPSIPMFNALSQGVPLKIVAAADGYSDDAMGKSDLTLVDDTALIVGKDSPITSVGELEGKTISVPARKAQLEVTISNAVKQAGGDPSKINWIVLDFSSAVQSLKQGRVDAAGLVAPFTSKAVADGGKVVSSPGVEFFEKGAVGLYVAGESTATKKAEQLKAFARAINKANAYANEHHDEALEIAAKLTDTPLEVLKNSALTYWPTEVRFADIQRVDTRLAELGFLPEEVKIDDSLILSDK